MCVVSVRERCRTSLVQRSTAEFPLAGGGGGSNCISELQFVVFVYPGICEVCVNHLVTVAGSDPIIRDRTWDFPFLTIFQVRCIKILRHSFPGSFWKVLNTYMGWGGFSGDSDGKESACNAGDLGSGRSPGEGNAYPLQHSCLGNPVGREDWQATVHGVTKSQTLLCPTDTYTQTHTRLT